MKYSTHSFLLPFLLFAGIILNSCNGGSNRSAKETVISDSTCTNTISSVQKDSISRKATSLRKQVKDSVQNLPVKRISDEIARNQKGNRVDTPQGEQEVCKTFCRLRQTYRQQVLYQLRQRYAQCWACPACRTT